MNYRKKGFREGFGSGRFLSASHPALLGCSANNLGKFKIMISGTRDSFAFDTSSQKLCSSNRIIRLDDSSSSNKPGFVDFNNSINRAIRCKESTERRFKKLRK
ncbi:hypothetical protein CMI42_00900 [Candidatus Pacearchaeota archaeon]|nr:hypothetical protein [Candidatus Pacearchaeota archaeon]